MKASELMNIKTRYCRECRNKARLIDVDTFSNIFPVEEQLEGFEVIYCSKCEKYFFINALPRKPKLVLIKNI